jgi:hypothetical protein
VPLLVETVRASSSCAESRTTVTPWRSSNDATPVTIWPTMRRLRSTLGPIATSWTAACMPNSAACWSNVITSAPRNSALAGMQPQLRQTPPIASRSTSATRSPSCAPRIAAT